MEKTNKPVCDESLCDEYAEFLFHQGTNFRAFEYMGAHPVSGGTVFRTWAPNADAVYLTGDFNGWSDSLPMIKITDGGIWAVRLEQGFEQGSRYKFLVCRDGKKTYKCDPYAFWSETKLNTASLYYVPSDCGWHDAEYMKSRAGLAAWLTEDKAPPIPMNVYEVHLGSWKRHADGSYYTYDELAESLAGYVASMNYTHVEFMPVAEHPFDGSWGYQICGYYAPTSRFGSPDGFKRLVDAFHAKGIGVILDWVPSHFPKDAHGLFEFDGSPLYEYSGADRMEHKSWGTRAFDVGRNEVRSFLISNAVYWIEKYHIDALRVDAVASMLYLDYDRKPGEWNPNPDGTNISRESVSFFRTLNAHIREKHPDVMMIAEESTAYPDVTKKHGLGFSLKWNMGWMNDTLSYVQTDSCARSSVHNKMTFSTSYAFSENYILPISHDEVVHGKKSLVDKMFGDYGQKFACMRAYLAYMTAHPGKKLLFMGGEYAQFREWDCESQLEWFMLDYPKHAEMQEYTRSLNAFYLASPELWEHDGDYSGFRWLDADRRNDNVYIFERFDGTGASLVCVFNFSPIHRGIYPVPVSESGWYRTVFETEAGANPKSLRSRKKDGVQSFIAEIPPLSACFFKNTKYISKNKNKSINTKSAKIK